MQRCAFFIPGDLATPTGGYAYDRRVLALLAGHAVAVEHVALPASYPAPTPADLEATAALIRRHADTGVALIDGLAFGAMPAPLLDLIRPPVVALCHHPLCLEAGIPPDRAAALQATEREALSRARAVVVTSPFTKAVLVRDFFVPAPKIVVAVPGTDPAPRATGSGGRPLNCLAVGTVVPRKGYDVLVRALSAMQDLPWHLTIVGALDRSPQTLTALGDQIAATGLQSRITLAGALGEAELADAYAAADVFLMPSLFEGYGMVLAEAMARGLPIVCTTGGAAAETAPAAAAIKVPPGDSSAFQRALHQVFSDAGLRQEMARASWSAGQQLPRWDTTARIIADVLRKVAP